MSNLDDIRARHAAATPGPWEFDGVEIDATTPGRWESVLASEVSCGNYCYGGSIRTTMKPENQASIEHAQEDIGHLLAAVDAIESVAQRLDMMSGHTYGYWARQIRAAVNEALEATP